MRLKDKTLLVTGATTGIGFAAAQHFLEEGATAVIITGQDEGRLIDAERALAARGLGKVTAIRWRAEDTEDSKALFDAVSGTHGHLDVVFANAGVTWPATFGQIDAIEAQRQFMVNVTGPLILLQTLAPLMRSGGSLILTTSCLDVLGMPGMAVYSASKAALRSLARTLSVELKERGVRVNSIAPGPVETPIYEKLGMSPEALKEMADGMRKIVPAGRFGTAEEIAGVAAFLASDASRYLMAEEINVDGGWANI
ncbi:MAG: SDR family oxidoreductase [Elainellaceae cyanobacterium]